MAHLLLIKCPDARGLVYRVTGVLFGLGLNRMRNGELVEREGDVFFMRTEFAGGFEAAGLLAQRRAVLPRPPGCA